ncbi:ubiquitin carboxyl-terminal hydrolase MINDY-2 isoform X2 [Ambystoma mexicanum]|uniref:ubiquitin carboxyl-terminal hydrolase MINDY-2 isoform X2 n=1 Tax=Ambystoma mexicanum TaxID=8296 RepID=UPI0037E7D766
MDNQKGSELVIGDVVSAALSLGEMSAQPGKAQPAYDDSEVSSVSAPAPRETPAAQCPGPPAHASSTVPDLHPLTPGQLEQRTLDSLASVSLPGSPPNIPGNASCSPHPSSASSLSPQGTGVDSHLLLSTTDSTERPLPLGDTGPVGTSPASPGTLHPDATSHSPLVPGASSSRPHVPKAASPSPTPEAASLGLRDASHAPLQASASPLNPGAALPVLISCLPTSSSPLPPGPNSPSSLPTSPSSLPGAVSPSLDSPGSSSRLQSHPSSDLSASEGPEEKVGRDRGPSQSGQPVYHIKWLQWKEQPTPIITQNENGPCPLLAIINVLLLAWKVKLPPMMEIITSEQLMEYLGDYILETKPKEISEVQRLNYEQNMNDAMAVLHKLQTGLDVNVKFTGIQVFEYTPECIVFDLLNIPLYHGWLVDPQVADVVNAVGNCSYNQLVEKVILCKQSDNSELVSQGIVAEQFLYATATQLTYHGLCELTSSVAEGELCVFFRNNHFSTMTKNKDQLYLLVTDQGFLTEDKIVWESLHNVDGDGNFCDAEFHLRPPSNPETVYEGQQDQIDQDYLIALSLQQEQQNQDIDWEQIPEGISDLELAKKLQEEEDRRASQYFQEQEQADASAQEGQQMSQPGSPASGQLPGSSDRKGKEQREKDKEKNSCALL